MAIYYPTIGEIIDTINNAQPEDVVYLPGEEISFPLQITNECTIRGQENTTINIQTPEPCLYLENSVDISGVNLQNLKENGHIGVHLNKFTGSVSNLNINGGDHGMKVENSNDFTVDEMNIVDSKLGLGVYNSMDGEFITVEINSCDMAYNIEGSSSIIGDIFSSQSFGLNFTNKTNLSGVSRVEKHIILNTSSFADTINSINDQLEGLSTLIEAYSDGNKVGIRVLGSAPENTTFILENNVNFGWAAGTYTDHLGTEDINYLTGEEFNIIVDRKEEYSIIINEEEYFFTCSNNSTYASLVSNLNNAKTSENNLIKELFHVNIANNDIKITSLTPNSLNIEFGTKDFFPNLNGFTSLPAVSTSSLEGERDDRTHHLHFVACQAYENTIGVRLANSDHITFDNCMVYSNNDIGIWHAPNSYENNFNGEIYNNKNYGVKNTDKKHEFVVRQTWWGDITGPSMMGSGSGDKVSAYVDFANWRQDGNEPELSYPKTRDWIWRMLGYPLVRVELTEDQITDSIEMAVDRYEEFRIPEQTYHYLQVSATQDIIELPVWMNRKEIVELVYSPHADLFSQLTGAGESFYLTYYLQQTGGTFLSDFYIAMAYKETLEKTLGIEPTYETFTQKNKNGEWRDYLRISPKPSVSLQVGILYNRPMTEEEVDSAVWIRKYALTWSKEQLGRIRSKFASVPGPTGEMQLDGQQLISEAQQERQSLEESLILKGPPLTFQIG